MFAGIDLSSPQREFTYAVLDAQLSLRALGDADLDELLRLLTEPRSAAVAVNAPSGLNLGIVREKIRHESPEPRQLRGVDLRLAEFELRTLGIAVAGTPSQLERCPAWMQSGFQLRGRLRELGFEGPAAGESPGRLMETHPEACFFGLLTHLPLPKASLEGRLQRQLILFESGVRIRDPMDFFEEITRHKLLLGNLPLDELYASRQLDALAAAYTAWLYVHSPGRLTWIGDEREGQLALPRPPLDAPR
jgi:hypothetical protein